MAENSNDGLEVRAEPSINEPETPYELAMEHAPERRMAGFIIDTGNGLLGDRIKRRELLHPIYGDFPLIQPGLEIPKKPELLQHVDTEVYQKFTRSLIKSLKRDRQVLIALSMIFGTILLAGILIEGDDIGAYLILGALVLVLLVSCYEGYTRPDVVKECQDSFRQHGIMVEEVMYYSDFYVRSANSGRHTRRDRSKYIIFSEITSSRETVHGEGQYDCLKIV